MVHEIVDEALTAFKQQTELFGDEEHQRDVDTSAE